MIQRARSCRRLGALLALGYVVAAALVGVAHRSPLADAGPSPERAALAVLDFLPADAVPLICGVATEDRAGAAHAYICEACRIVDAPGLAVAPPPVRVATGIVGIDAPRTGSAIRPAFLGAPPLGPRAPPVG
jgi:hypothetical protein